MQGQKIFAILSFGFGVFRGAFFEPVGQTRHFFFIGEIFKSIGGIQHVFAEFIAGLCQFFVNVAEGFLSSAFSSAPLRVKLL